MESTETFGSSDVQSNLRKFDELDFEIFSNQRWADFTRSHSEDIVVHWPDGHETRGLERHLDDMRAMFVYAPDTRIRVHSIRIGAGEWTSVVGEMEGTFTRPMQFGGKTVQPTGKSFRVPMCTVGRWENGVMVEEYLFWDNLTYFQQMGVM